MNLNHGQRRKIPSRYGLSRSNSSSKACSSKAALRSAIVIIGVFVLISIHLLNVVVSNKGEVERHVTQSRGIDQAVKKQKSTLLEHKKKHMNAKENNGSSNLLRRKGDIHEVSDVSGKGEQKEYLVSKSKMDTLDKKSETTELQEKVSHPFPALVGASKGKVVCDVNIKSLVYWNDPQGMRDTHHVSPFIGKNPDKKTKYLTFEADRGGWNNLRMSLESVFIIAAALGRTLVLPPDAPLYLLGTRGFADFFPIHSSGLLSKVPIITTDEFFQLEVKENKRFPVPPELEEKVFKSTKVCDNREIAENSCFALHKYFSSVGYVPEIDEKHCLVFDHEAFDGEGVSVDNFKKIKSFCKKSKVFYFNNELQAEPLIHLQTRKTHRFISHFYGQILFTDPVIDNYYKRFVRDHLHYHDKIFCAAGKIINALQEMGKNLGVAGDSADDAAYSSMHVRRGDLQFKEVKISGEEWNENLKEIWLENELIYIATDEKNKTFFDPIAQNHTLKYLDDFKEIAGLDELDPNYMGMIDTIVASKGRTFSGTWFSTFSGYINRMRGYHGISMKHSYYGFKPRKTRMHEWPNATTTMTYQFEWPAGWVGIDGDTIPNRTKF